MRLLGEVSTWVGFGAAAIANVTGHIGWLFLAALAASCTLTITLLVLLGGGEHA